MYSLPVVKRERGYLLHRYTFVSSLFFRSCINYCFQPFNYTFYYLLSGLSVLVWIATLPQAFTLDPNNEFVLETEVCFPYRKQKCSLHWNSFVSLHLTWMLVVKASLEKVMLQGCFAKPCTVQALLYSQ